MSFRGKFKLEKRGNGEIYIPAKLARILEKKLKWKTGQELELLFGESGSTGENYLRVYKRSR